MSTRSDNDVPLTTRAHYPTTRRTRSRRPYIPCVRSAGAARPAAGGPTRAAPKARTDPPVPSSVARRRTGRRACPGDSAVRTVPRGHGGCALGPTVDPPHSGETPAGRHGPAWRTVRRPLSGRRPALSGGGSARTWATAHPHAVAPGRAACRSCPCPRAAVRAVRRPFTEADTTWPGVVRAADRPRVPPRDPARGDVECGPPPAGPHVPDAAKSVELTFPAARAPRRTTGAPVCAAVSPRRACTGSPTGPDTCPGPRSPPGPAGARTTTPAPRAARSSGTSCPGAR